MKPETITALLALWERCPETLHPAIFVDGAVVKLKLLGNALTGPALTDFACGQIERWMSRPGTAWSVVEDRRTTCDPEIRWQFTQLGVEPGRILESTVARNAPTKLDCLISAANAVLDAEGKTT